GTDERQSLKDVYMKRYLHHREIYKRKSELSSQLVLSELCEELRSVLLGPLLGKTIAMIPSQALVMALEAQIRFHLEPLEEEWKKLGEKAFLEKLSNEMDSFLDGLFLEKRFFLEEFESNPR